MLETESRSQSMVTRLRLTPEQIPPGGSFTPIEMSVRFPHGTQREAATSGVSVPRDKLSGNAHRGKGRLLTVG